jgi:chromosomal replication initiation ATPase DnaA
MTTTEELKRIDAQIAKLLARRKELVVSPTKRLESVLVAVESVYGITPEEIRSEGRPEVIAYARQVAMCLMMEFGYNNCEVGRLMSKDHGTVNHAKKRVSGLVGAYPVKAKEYYQARVALGLDTEKDIGEKPTLTRHLQPE